MKDSFYLSLVPSWAHRKALFRKGEALTICVSLQALLILLPVEGMTLSQSSYFPKACVVSGFILAVVAAR